MKQDPKYKFGTEDKIWHINGKYFLPEDEPKILFRGKDIGTIIAMESYKDFMKYVEKYTNDKESRRIAREHIESIEERIEIICNWIKDNPNRIGLGCHTCKNGESPYSILTEYINFKMNNNE